MSTSTQDQAVFIFCLSIDQQSARDFAIMLNEWSTKNKGAALRIDINSVGGNIGDGLFLYEELLRLRRAGHRLTMAAYGRAASSAGWLLQAAEKRIIGAQSWLLVHEVMSEAKGTITQMKQEIARCEQLQDQTFGILCARSRLTRAMIDEKVLPSRDWWITAREAFELGLVDEIEDVPVSAA